MITHKQSTVLQTNTSKVLVQYPSSLCFGACLHKQYGTYVFASAHRVTGPWNQEEFDSNDEDSPLRSSEGYHRRL